MMWGADMPVQKKDAEYAKLLGYAKLQRRVYVIFLLCWQLDVIGKYQSCFWLRIAMDVWREDCGIESMKCSETCHWSGASGRV